MWWCRPLPPVLPPPEKEAGEEKTAIMNNDAEDGKDKYNDNNHESHLEEEEETMAIRYDICERTYRRMCVYTEQEHAEPIWEILHKAVANTLQDVAAKSDYFLHKNNFHIACQLMCLKQNQLPFYLSFFFFCSLEKSP